MAKKKTRKQVEKKGFKYPIELKGILFILIGIIGFLGFKANILGTIFKGFAMFLMGSFDFVVLSLFILSGGYMLVKRENPKVVTTRLIGFYILLIGVLALAHLNYLGDKPTITGTIRETLDEFVKCINTEVSFPGGGILGAILISVLYILLGKMGSTIVIIVLMIIGVILIADLSISEGINSIHEKIKSGKEERKKRHLEEDDENDEYDDKDIDDDIKDVLNDKEPDKKIIVSSIDQLTHVNTDEEYEEAVKEANKMNSNKYANYELPSLSLLDAPKKKSTQENEADIKKNIGLLEKVLADFDVHAKVREVHVGPSVTQYELEIKSGTKMSKIKSLSSEIALALAAKDVRIQAPIPGKSTVGIELPNKVNSAVSFREIISAFPKNKMDSKLMVALGKDIMGTPRYAEINKTPHLLIAGATGSGKSVCVNCIIGSILMRAKPDEVKLIMVDPKKVELSMYNGIPHLLMPVITDPKKASAALQKVVEEMEHRYDLFSDSKTKNIEGYNNYLENKNKNLPEESRIPLMPYIVVLIDELADLMLVASKEVEDSIMRITQMARAAGIHLIVATQRPSTDVITGVVKANIPSRISFAVSSSIDSRTILDMTGAEKLLGKGDMLFLPMGESVPMRIQGAFVSEDEINKLVDFTVSQQKAVYDESFMKLDQEKEKPSLDKDDVDHDDPLYNDIVEYVITAGKASASLLQRRFKLGYNRAARIIDLLEERGIVGPQNGSKPREVLVALENDNEDDE